MSNGEAKSDDCPTTEELGRYLTGQPTLDPETSERIGTHLEVCEPCQDDLDRLTEELSDDPSSPPSGARPTLDERDEAVLEKIKWSPAPGASAPFHRTDRESRDGDGVSSPLSGGIIDSLEATTGLAMRVALNEPGKTDDERHTPLPPEIDLGSERYTLMGELGRGGMGLVLLGRDDELGRELAIKVLLEEHRNDTDLLRRFAEEAQIGGQLQHPGLVPVYDLGIMPDRRPYFTMRKVGGRNLAERLRERPDPSFELTKYLKVFEQVCQAVAFAHARGVIHRDLKSANVMAGDYGEVHVVDWGLAKVLDGTPRRPNGQSVARWMVPVTGPASRSHAGSVVGTPEYMAPEQARGEVEHLDERCDVFGLGAILCEILTGRPAYVGLDDEVRRLASLCDTSEALAGLDACPPDVSDLVDLTRRCLSLMREKRPRNAKEVADAVAAHFANAQERLRRAELENVRAEERARRERQARRLTVALAASILCLVSVGGGGWAWLQSDRATRRLETARAVNQAIDESLVALGQAKEAPEDLNRWGEALSAARRAEGLLAGREAAPDLRARVGSAVRDAESMARDRRMLDRIEALRSQLFFPGDQFDPRRAMPNYAAAFRDYGIDVEALSPKEAAVLIQKSPIRKSLLAALDWWTSLSDGQLAMHIFDTYNLVDPDPYRRVVRYARLSGDDETLRAAAYMPEAATLPTHLALGLTMKLKDHDREKAEEILQTLWQKHPEDFWVNYHLGILWVTVDPPKPAESIRYLTAAGVLRPENPLPHLMLAGLLKKEGDRNGSIASYRRVVRILPNNVGARLKLAMSLEDAGDRDGAQAEYRAALNLAPDPASTPPETKTATGRAAEIIKMVADYAREIGLGSDMADAHFQIGRAKYALGDRKAAESELREAIRLRPDFADAHSFLGSFLADIGNWQEAERETREAIRLTPESGTSHFGLGVVLFAQNRFDESITEIRNSIRLEPAGARQVVAQMLIAKALLRNGDGEAAVAAYHDVLRTTKSLEALLGLGEALIKINKPIEAAVPLSEAVKLEPQSPDAHAVLGAALADQGLLAKAIAEVREAVLLRPGDAHTHSFLAVLLDRAKDPVGAEAQAREALRINQNDADAHRVLGSVLLIRNQIDEAKVELLEAIRLQPEDAASHGSLSIILRFQGELDEAIKEAREAIRSAPEVFSTHSLLAETLMAKGDEAAAAAEFRTALKLNPNDYDSHINLGVLLDRAGELRAAESEFRLGVALKPEDVLAHTNLGSVLERLGDWRGVAATCHELTKIKPDDPQTWFNLGRVLSVPGELDAAVVALREALRLKPGWPEAHAMLGYVLDRKGDLDAAAAEYREAVRIKPDYPDVHVNLGNVLERLGDLRGATADRKGDLNAAAAEYREAVRIKPDYPEAHANLGRVLSVPGELDAAVAALREALRLKPGWPEAHAMLGYAFEIKGQPDAAAAEYREAVRLKPDYPEAHGNLGSALNTLGELVQSEAECREAIQLRPDLAAAHCTLGLILRQKRQLDEALAELRRGHELGMKTPGWALPSAIWLSDCERLLQLLVRLPGVLGNKEAPSGPEERRMFAELCRARGQYGAAARLLEEALAEVLFPNGDLRHEAARSAALAASGRGSDDPALDAVACSRWRSKGLGWLREDLESFAQQIQRRKETRLSVALTLRRWRSDIDLAGLRDDAVLRELPEEEQSACRKLWADVNVLLLDAAFPDWPFTP